MLQDYLKILLDNDELKVIETPLDIDLEIAHLSYIEVKKSNSKALLFTNPTNGEIPYNMPVLTNLFGSYKRVELFLGDVEKYAKDITNLLHYKPSQNILENLKSLPMFFKLRNLSPKHLQKQGDCQYIKYFKENIDLGKIPILKTWSKDGGAFITMGQVYTQSEDGKVRNLGMYRLQVLSKNEILLHWQIHKDSTYIFNEYKKANKKMPVSIAIGGDPLYTWCATAPLPRGMFELMLYGFMKNKKARLVKSLTNPIFIPADADIVIEGYVDTTRAELEGPFGDHTGFYTPIEPYPVLEITAITTTKSPIYLATVVGKPPLEDKYMGYATERLFLPLLKTNAPDLIDYKMPENGVFHNLILAKIKPSYPSHAKQIMHTFWGIGQMSFVKHAIFVDENAPDLDDYEALTKHILNRFDTKNLMISKGVCDALDHASPSFAEGGKLGIDCTGEVINTDFLDISDDEILRLVKNHIPQSVKAKIYYKDTSNPIMLLNIDKKDSIKNLLKQDFDEIYKYVSILIVFDSTNDIENLYMSLWKAVNNIDAIRDLYINKISIIDATAKNISDDYTRVWPEETNCEKYVIESLRSKDLLNEIDDEFLKKFQILG